jgi:Rps23 Pro-64 3,4-dihydroxylase Tpa1-like proline 4-hydroxylase
MLNPDLDQRAPALAEKFAVAEPFRHVVIEDFFDARTADALLQQFPPFEARNARNEAGGIGDKAVVERIRALGADYAALDALIQSRQFLGLIGRITGIPDLRYDPHYFGGGTHDNRHGQSLDAHIDFNYHPVTRWHRRLNLIVYLNPQWEAGWGGELELHTDPYSSEDRITAVTPLFNRCVIFETSEHSWHGFPEIRLPESQRQLTRKSVALYFYTEERPAEEVAPAHATHYVDRPLPAHIAVGHGLTQADVEELQRLLTRRDDHMRRLYGEITELTARNQQLNRVLLGGPLYRFYYLLRRLWFRLRH